MHKSNGKIAFRYFGNKIMFPIVFTLLDLDKVLIGSVQRFKNKASN